MKIIEEHELAIAIILSMYDDIVEARWWARRLKAENAMLQRENERIQGYADSTDEVADILRIEIGRLKLERDMYSESWGDALNELHFFKDENDKLKRILRSIECAECRKDMYDCDCEESE